MRAAAVERPLARGLPPGPRGWGALGGFIAIPAVLIALAIFRHIIPGITWLADAGIRRRD